uniref:CCHC-type domain-containing protein n=1 Tax=Cannabis sativa TaxID=3483 RepID=A0A803NNF9_CANSA
MDSRMVLSEKERAVHSFTDTNLSLGNHTPKHFLVVRCLSNALNPKTFIKKMGDFWSNKCRFPVEVSEMHSDLFLLTIGCAGDKIRILNGEPWHYFNKLILLHSPKQLHNVSKDDFSKAQFWVQAYRLPFLSKSRALAMKVGKWIGDYVDVYEDSVREGWGSYIRIRVLIDISHPLMRGKLVTLPKVRDEHWLEFRHENLPIFCFHCGRIGHPFEKCHFFMELVDSGIDPDLPFGPSMMGDKLPNSAIPITNHYQTRMINLPPHPSPLTDAESSNHSLHQTEAIPELLSPFPTFFQSLSSTMLTSTTDCINAYSTSLSSLSNPSVTTNIFATYPPPNIPIPPPSKGLNPIFCDATTTSVKDKGKAILIEEVAQHGNTSSKTFKMQVDPGNFRSVLKRCRNNTGNSKEGPLRREALMDDFRQIVDVCNLVPLAFSGDKFTWTNRNFQGVLVKERLDRGIEPPDSYSNVCEAAVFRLAMKFTVRLGQCKYLQHRHSWVELRSSGVVLASFQEACFKREHRNPTVLAYAIDFSNDA